MLKVKTIHLIQIKIAQHIHIVQEKRLAIIEKARRFSSRRRYPKLGLAGDFEVNAEIVFRAEKIYNLISKMKNVDHHFGAAGLDKPAQDDLQHRHAVDVDERFRTSVRQRPEPAANAGGEDHGFQFTNRW
jgi:hypothetical protein